MNNDQTIPFSFSFAYSLTEWIRILREAEVRNFPYWFNKVLGLLFLLIGIYEIVLGIWLLKVPNPTVWRDGIWNILYGVLIVIFILIASLDLVTLYKLWVVSRRRKKIGPKIYEFEFDEQEARFTGRDTQGNEEVKLSWNHFSRVLLRKTAIILYLKDGGMWAIPRRVFTTTQSAQAFQQFVEFRIDEAKALATQNSGYRLTAVSRGEHQENQEEK